MRLTAIGDDADFITTVNNAIAAVQADVNANETAANLVSALETARELVTDAISARVTTLETDPTTQTVVDNLETALDARLDGPEADPTTQTLLDAEETARENADALSGRLDTQAVILLLKLSLMLRLMRVFQLTILKLFNLLVKLTPVLLMTMLCLEGWMYWKLIPQLQPQ